MKLLLIIVLLSLLLCSFHDADFIEMTRVSYISLVLFHVMELLSKAALVLLVFFVSRNVREYLVFTHFYFSMQLLSKAALVLFDFFVSRHVREYLVFSHFYFSMHFYSCFWVLKWIEREFKHTLNFTKVHFLILSTCHIIHGGVENWNLLKRDLAWE